MRFLSIFILFIPLFSQAAFNSQSVSDAIQSLAHSQAEFDAKDESNDDEAIGATDLPMEQVNTNELKLLGRGIAKSGGTQSLALACYHSDCKTLRFVYFSDRQTATYVGDPIAAPSASNPKILKKAYQLVIREYLDFHPALDHDSRVAMITFAGFVLVVGGAAAIALAPGTGGLSLGLSAKIFSILLGGSFFLMSNSFIDFAIGDSLVSATMNDQHNWNWSIQPKELSQKRFNHIARQIVSGHSISALRHEDHYTYEMADEYLQKKNKLIEKGAEFQSNAFYSIY